MEEIINFRKSRFFFFVAKNEEPPNNVTGDNNNKGIKNTPTHGMNERGVDDGQ